MKFKAGDLLHYKEPKGMRVLVLFIADHPRMKHAARDLFVGSHRTYNVPKACLEVRNENR